MASALWRASHRRLACPPLIPRQFSSQSVSVKDYYSILEVPMDANQVQIKDAFYKLSLTYHPDRNTEMPDTAKKFSDITEAYKVLGNPEERMKYDAKLSILRGKPLQVPDLPSTRPSAADTYDKWLRDYFAQARARRESNKLIQAERRIALSIEAMEYVPVKDVIMLVVVCLCLAHGLKSFTPKDEGVAFHRERFNVARL